MRVRRLGTGLECHNMMKLTVIMETCVNFSSILNIQFTTYPFIETFIFYNNVQLLTIFLNLHFPDLQKLKRLHQIRDGEG